MLELMSYGLSSLIAVLAVACYLAFDDDFAPATDKRPFDPISKADVLGSSKLIEPGSDILHNDRGQRDPER